VEWRDSVKRVIIASMLCSTLLISGCSSNVEKSTSATKEGTNVTIKSDSVDAIAKADMKTLPEEYPKNLLPISAEDKLTSVNEMTVNGNLSITLEVESNKNTDELSNYYLTYIGGNNLVSSKSEKSLSITGALKGDSKYTASIVGKYNDNAKKFIYNIIVSFNK